MPNIYFELTAFNAKQAVVALASGQAVVYYRIAIMSKDGDWVIRETTNPDRIIALATSSGGSSKRPVARLAATGAVRHAVVLALAEEIGGLQQADRRRTAIYESAARPYIEECRAAGIDLLPLREAHDRTVEIAERLLTPAPTTGSPDADAQ